MAPRGDDEDDDPVTAEYDVFLTAAQQEQIYLLQYLNRTRDRPYSQRFGAQPTDFRLKPNSGYIELDVELSTSYNFNKYQSLRWGDAMETAKTIQNDSATYGPAAGLGIPRGRPSARSQLKDKADRETQISNDLTAFRRAEDQDRVMHKQTLGGQLFRNNSEGDDAGQPVYFLGAFSGNQLHLSKVDGTVQMRPQFHHIDAEEHRNKLATSRAAAGEGEVKPAPVARGLTQSYKDTSDDKDKSAPERLLRKALQDAEEESWVPLDYVDEAEEAAYEIFHERMFVHGVDTTPELKSSMDDEQFLDAISVPRHGSPTRRRKRPPRTKNHVELEDGEGEGGGEEAGGEAMKGVAETG